MGAMPIYAIVAVLSGGGGALATYTTGDATVVNTVTIEQCMPFIKHERQHCSMECAINELKAKP